jgi:pimeloyl-ACP methyl ester carboxylesterase
MQYDASRNALYHPELQPPLPKQFFAGKPEALCAELARLAYFRFEQDASELRQALEAHGLGRVQCFVNTQVGTQAFAALDQAGTAYVAFRGTQPHSLKDLVTDLKAVPVAWIDGTQVHSGFARAYDPPPALVGAADVNPRTAIAAWLDASGCRRLVCTGHSLGAALATLLAADRAEAELVSVGSPRVGDAAFARLFDGRAVSRYVDCTDGVTLLPPPVIFEHVGESAYIDRRGMLHPDGMDSAALLADHLAAHVAYLVRYTTRFWRNVLLRSLADHAPINYVSALLGIREP